MNNADIDERFFNLKPATLASVHEYKRSRDPALVQLIFDGIMRNYLPESAGDPVSPSEEATFAAFGLDSLTLLEVVLDLQDALDIRLTDDEVRGMHTIEEARALLLQKAAALHRAELLSASSAPSL